MRFLREVHWTNYVSELEPRRKASTWFPAKTGRNSFCIYYDYVVMFVFSGGKPKLVAEIYTPS
jgi:hypothetical protein